MATKTTKEKVKCLICGKEYLPTSFYSTHSIFFKGSSKLPYCKNCIKEIYQKYYKKYIKDGCLNPEYNAVKRVCMMLDIYFNEDVFNTSVAKSSANDNASLIAAYMRIIQLQQYNETSYDTTIDKELKNNLTTNMTEKDIEGMDVDKRVVEFFGKGFSEEDYKFLKREYDDWIARHECKTKAQEEVFKRLCFKQLEILKATRNGEDTTKLDATFQNLLDTAKLQPKQNSGDASADNQTFGTLIDKWENTRPLPEIDEELKDVDKIGFYIDTFFRGHTCKMLNVKNAFSNLYSSMLKTFTVNKPEYDKDCDEDSELTFDKIFGSKNIESDNNEGVV